MIEANRVADRCRTLFTYTYYLGLPTYAGHSGAVTVAEDNALLRMKPEDKRNTPGFHWSKGMKSLFHRIRIYSRSTHHALHRVEVIPGYPSMLLCGRKVVRSGLTSRLVETYSLRLSLQALALYNTRLTLCMRDI